jgi:hypothetical protein
MPRAKKVVDTDSAPKKSRKKTATVATPEVTACNQGYVDQCVQVEVYTSEDATLPPDLASEENENIILQLQVDSTMSMPNTESMTFEEAFYTYDPRIEVPDAFEQSNDFSSKPCTIQDSEPSASTNMVGNSNGKSSTTSSKKKTQQATEKAAAVNNEKRGGSSRVYDHLGEFLSRDDWPIRTDTACFWCCHTFTNTPVGLPVKYINNRFHVHGCFCSLECCAAYNFYSLEFKHDVWEGYHLINLLAKKIQYDVVVKMAPPRQCLKLFGGYMDISEFRHFCDSGKLVNTHNHPMVAMSQQLEEVNDSEQYHHRKNMFIPVDKQKLFMLESKVKLERTKPLYSNKNTLDHAMNLKIEA